MPNFFYNRTDLCLKNNNEKENDPSKACIHWTNIFDMLFRGTNIKLSK
jgi:hypothetical protein